MTPTLSRDRRERLIVVFTQTLTRGSEPRPLGSGPQQLQECQRNRFRFFARKEMPGAWDDAPRHQGREDRAFGWRHIRGWAREWIGGAIEQDGRSSNRRTFREFALHLLKTFFAWRVSIAMAVGMNHHFNEVGILE